MPGCVFKVEFFFSFPGITRGYSTCHVPSLLPAGSRSSSSWRLQRTQTSTDSSINWFADISLWKNNNFFILLLRSQAGTEIHAVFAEIPHAGYGCSSGPDHPEGQVETHSMTCDWVSSSEPSTDMTSCSTVHQHQCRAHVILLPVSGQVSCQKLTPDLFELVSSSEMFTAGARHQIQLEIKWNSNCKITNWAASLRTPSALKSLLLWIWLYLCSAFLLPYLLSPSHPNPSMS